MKPAPRSAFDRLIAPLAAAVPLAFFPGALEGFASPGFFEPFVVPRELFVLAVLGTVACVAALRDEAALRRARGPLLALAAIGIGSYLPHVFGEGDAAAAMKSARRLGVVAALLFAGAALGAAGAARFLRMTACAAVGLLLVGAARRLGGFPSWIPDRADVGFASTIGNSNELAEYAAPAAVALAAAAVLSVDRGARRAFAIGAAASVSAVIWSRSRGGALAIGVGGALVAAIWIREAAPGRRLRRAGSLAAVVAGFVLITALVPAAAPLRYAAAGVFDASRPTAVVRLRTWSGTAELIAANPAGVGGGRFEAAYPPHRPPDEWRISGLDSRVDHPHQEFLAAAAEAGPLGLAGFVALLLLAARRGARALRAKETRAFGGALLASTAAFAVLSLVRAPFAHPSGVAVLLPLLGALGPAETPRRGAWVRAVVLAFVVSGLAAACWNATQDVRLGGATAALNAAKSAQASGDANALARRLTEAARRISEVGGIAEDSARLYRAAVAADDLASARAGLVAANVARETAVLLPDFVDVARLADLVLVSAPAHASALRLRAAAESRGGRFAAAEATLKEALALLPRAPQIRTDLARLYEGLDQGADTTALAFEKLAEAERLYDDESRLGREPDEASRVVVALAALRTGSDASTFGRLLGPPDQDLAPAGLDLARRLREEGRLEEARRIVLSALHDRPADGRLLDELAHVGFARARRGDDGAAAEASRAFARSRTRYAVGAETAEDLPQARTWLRLALLRNPRLWDAHFLAARLAAADGDAEGVIAAIAALKAAGASDSTVAKRAAEDPVLRAHFK